MEGTDRKPCGLLEDGGEYVREILVCG